MQLQDFPIDSHTFMWVRCMINSRRCIYIFNGECLFACFFFCPTQIFISILVLSFIIGTIICIALHHITGNIGSLYMWHYDPKPGIKILQWHPHTYYVIISIVHTCTITIAAATCQSRLSVGLVATLSEWGSQWRTTEYRCIRGCHIYHMYNI